MRRTGHAAYRIAIIFLVGWLAALVPHVSAQVQRGWLSTEAMNARLDSVEAMALQCEKSDRRFSLVSVIAVSGWTRSGPDAPPPPPPYPGIVARLSRIYRACDDYGTRYAIVSQMPAQAERTDAVAFLAEVAQEPPSAGVPGILADDVALPLPYQAVGILSRLGPDGRAALQRLHAEGTVRHPAARRRLEGIAHEGFPEPRRPS